MSWVISLLINSAALLIADWFISDIYFSGAVSAIIAAVVLGIINTLIRPILVMVTLPLTIISLGLFIFVINAIAFALVAYLVPGFHVYSFSGAFWGAIITSLIGWALSQIFNRR